MAAGHDRRDPLGRALRVSYAGGRLRVGAGGEVQEPAGTGVVGGPGHHADGHRGHPGATLLLDLTGKETPVRSGTLRVAAVLFDFDGTLTVPDTLDFTAVRRAVGCPAGLGLLEFLAGIADAEDRRVG